MGVEGGDTGCWSPAGASAWGWWACRSHPISMATGVLWLGPHLNVALPRGRDWPAVHLPVMAAQRRAAPHSWPGVCQAARPTARGGGAGQSQASQAGDGMCLPSPKLSTSSPSGSHPLAPSPPAGPQWALLDEPGDHRSPLQLLQSKPLSAPDTTLLSGHQPQDPGLQSLIPTGSRPAPGLPADSPPSSFSPPPLGMFPAQRGPHLRQLTPEGPPRLPAPSIHVTRSS